MEFSATWCPGPGSASSLVISQSAESLVAGLTVSVVTCGGTDTRYSNVSASNARLQPAAAQADAAQARLRADWRYTAEFRSPVLEQVAATS